MADPVVHFEIIGKTPGRGSGPTSATCSGWEFDTSAPVADAVSEPTNYGFVNRPTASDGTGIPGGIGGGAGYDAHPDLLRRRSQRGGRLAAGREPGGSATFPLRHRRAWSSASSLIRGQRDRRRRRRVAQPPRRAAAADRRGQTGRCG